MENSNVQDLIKAIESNELGGSIYSREDVTRILRMVKVNQTSSLNIEYIVQDLNSLYDTIDDIEADTDSAEFSITNGNEICIDSCDVSNSEALDEVNDIIHKLRAGSYKSTDIVESLN